MQWKLGTFIAGAQVQSLFGELRPHKMCYIAKYIYLNGNLVKAMVFPVVMYGCKTWTIKKAECRRTVMLEKVLERVPWTARSNQSILKEISPEYSLEGLMLKLYNTLDTWCKELIHWKKPWYWERLKAGGEGGNRGWDGWMASLTQRTWVCTSSKSWWWTGKPGVLQSMGLKELGHSWMTELNWESDGGRGSDQRTTITTCSFTV